MAPLAALEETAAAAGNEQQNSDSLPLILMPGLEAVTQTDEHRHIFTKHLEISSIPEITAAQRALVTARTSSFKAANDTATPTAAAALAELNVRSHLIAISDHVMGIRVDTFESSDNASGTSYQTQWFDLKNPAELTTRDLFGSEASWAAFKNLVAQAASNDPRLRPEGQLLFEDVWLDSVTFDIHGNVQVAIDNFALATNSSGVLIVSVTAEKVTNLLSDFGTAASSALISPHTLSRLREALATEAPTATPTAPHDREHQVAPMRRSIDCSTEKCVALTFDDGPGPKTGKLLDSLEAGNAPSTFFVTGPNAKLRPEMLQRMVSEGHQIGNHTWSHRSLTSLSAAHIRREIDRTDTVISEAVSSSAALLRPPSGAHNSGVDRVANTPIILWDVDTLDWKHRNTAKVVKSAVQQSTPGSIVLMHDIHSTTVDAIPAILSGLKAKGYTFVTVEELMGRTGLNRGETYSAGPHPVTKSAHEAGKASR